MNGDKKFMFGIWGLIIATLIGGIFILTKTSSSSPTPISQKEITEQILTVASDDWTKGNSEASVVLVEYLDFECEVCATYYPLMKELVKEFQGEVLFVNRYYPLVNHKNSTQAALAVEAAGKQGKYWEMHNILFEKQKEWGKKIVADPKLFEPYAKELKLDFEQFQKDVTSKELRERIIRDTISGDKLGVDGTPSFFLNGEKIKNPRSLEEFRILIQAAILKAPKPEEQALGEKTHEHADFKVFLNGKAFDFSIAKYQESAEKPLTENVHLHDGVATVVHKHRQGVTLAYFFKTLGMSFDSQCFVADDGKKYCNDEMNSLKFFVNGKVHDGFGEYEFSDLDTILISYGPKDENVEAQLSSLTDDACLYSEKCPERGIPPTENCVGGLGTEC